MRIEPAQHAVDCRCNERFVAHRFDIIALDAPEYLRERTQLIDRKWQFGILVRNSRKIQADQNARHQADTDKTVFFEATTHYVFLVNA